MIEKADIVTLMKGDKLKYPKTHAEAVEGLDQIVEAKFKELATLIEPRVITLPLQPDFTNYHSSNALALKLTIQGGIGIINGIVKNAKEIKSSSDKILISDISQYVSIISGGTNVDSNSGMNRHLSEVNANGEVLISRNGTSSFIDIAPNSWITINLVCGVKAK